MKTPRELILQRHRSTEAKLKSICSQDLAEYARAAAYELNKTRRPVIGLAWGARQFWQEAIRPWHKVWIGLGSAWLVIAALNLFTNTTPQMAFRNTPRLDPAVWMAVREQNQLLAHLLESAVPPPPPANPPGPRSEWHDTVIL